MTPLSRFAAVTALTVALSTLSPVVSTSTAQAPTTAAGAGTSTALAATPVALAPGKGSGKGKGTKDTLRTGKNRKPGSPPRHYRPPTGVRFNNPYAPRSEQFRISDHILRTIDSVARGEKIRIATWNLRSSGVADALIRAHRRGVSVRIVMDQLNANAANPNPDVARVRSNFRGFGNKKRKADMRSFLRLCVSSCRGNTGIAHSKYYLFSRVGKARGVVIYGSHNLTELAATIQWNDVFTVKNRPEVYNSFLRIFNESTRDKRANPPFRRFIYGKQFGVEFYPNAGRKVGGDPAMRWLKAVRCTGATGGTGNNGRTIVRVGQTAMHGARGTALAKQLAAMKRAGCDIRVVYAMFANDVVRILHDAGIPLVHLAQDFDRDGSYDRYIHMKVLAISGVYAGQTNAKIVFNGASNWSPFALDSDEEVGILRYPKIVQRYINWINTLRRPGSWGPDYDSPYGPPAPNTNQRQLAGRGTDSQGEVEAPMRLDGEVS